MHGIQEYFREDNETATYLIYMQNSIAHQVLIGKQSGSSYVKTMTQTHCILIYFLFALGLVMSSYVEEKKVIGCTSLPISVEP